MIVVTTGLSCQTIIKAQQCLLEEESRFDVDKDSEGNEEVVTTTVMTRAQNR